MLRLLRTGTLALMALSAATMAQAEVIATLTFDTPSDTVANNVSIPIWLTLTLDPASDALITDASGYLSPQPTFTSGQIADLGGDTTNVNLNNTVFGSGLETFFAANSGYTFHFNFDPATDFIAPLNLDLEPGSSLDFLFGTMDLTNGATHGGVYTFFNASADFQSDGGLSFFAQTCPTYDASCGFSRTVREVVPPGTGAAAPEPAAWALMIAGLGLAGTSLRHRRRLLAV